MEIIIQILILFIVVNNILKLSFWKWWQAAILGLIAAIFIIGMQQYAITQSKTQLHDYLANRRILQDVAVFITVEAAIYFAFCFAAMKNLFGKKKKRWMLRPLYWYPGLLLFPALFYILTQSIFSFPGVDFKRITYSLAISVFLLLPAAAYGIKRLFPEKEFRLEVHFLVSIFVAILGLLTTVNGEVTYAAVQEPFNLKALGLSLAIFIFTFVAGYAGSKIHWIIRHKKEKRTHVTKGEV